MSLFSGIEAASSAWGPLGWECAAVSEIDPFACAFLSHRYPQTPNLGDVLAITEKRVAALGRVDLVVFGSPCQDLSVAGKRAGLDGERSGLFHDAVRIVRWAREHCGCRFALWENVPGAFSSNTGRDFAAVLARFSGLADIQPPPRGWGTEGAALGPEALVEWATLDAQWFGIPQRRRRVFALADSGDWASRPEILLEPDSLRGNPAARRGEGQDVAGSLTRRIGRGGVNSEGTDNPLIPQPYETANCLTKRMHKDINTTVDEGQTPVLAHTLRGTGFDASEDGTGRGTPLVTAFDARQYPVSNVCVTGALSSTSPQAQAVSTSVGVRRITPREAERLQGFQDDWTLVPYRRRSAKDGPRYQALGNSMAVPVMAWIGRRIQAAVGAQCAT